MSGITLGIDLGTTNSVVAVADGEQVTVLADEAGNRLIPSVVSFHPERRILVGEEARDRRLIDARNTVYSVKRLIGRPYKSPEVATAKSRFAFQLTESGSGGVVVTVRDETYTLTEISAFVLREVRRIAEARLGQPVNRAVITVPANFNELQRSATKAAGRVAGLEVARIINEPTAAALAYGYGKKRSERVAVFDLGGGTFDLTILDLEKDVFEVVATQGDSFLGGDDIDLLIAESMADQFLRQHRYDVRADTQAFERLRAAAEWAKCQLSADEKVAVTVEELAYGDSGHSLDLAFNMTRAELEQRMRPTLDRSIEVCKLAMKQARLTVNDIDSVVLVGGSTRIPLVREMVTQFFGQSPRQEIDPDLVVAQGAALHALALGGPQVAHGRMALGRVALKKVTLTDLRAAQNANLARKDALPKQPAFAPTAQVEQPDPPSAPVATKAAEAPKPRSTSAVPAISVGVTAARKAVPPVIKGVPPVATDVPAVTEGAPTATRNVPASTESAPARTLTAPMVRVGATKLTPPLIDLDAPMKVEPDVGTGRGPRAVEPATLVTEPARASATAAVPQGKTDPGFLLSLDEPVAPSRSPFVLGVSTSPAKPGRVRDGTARFGTESGTGPPMFDLDTLDAPVRPAPRPETRTLMGMEAPAIPSAYEDLGTLDELESAKQPAFRRQFTATQALGDADIQILVPVSRPRVVTEAFDGDIEEEVEEAFEAQDLSKNAPANNLPLEAFPESAFRDGDFEVDEFDDAMLTAPSRPLTDSADDAMTQPSYPPPAAPAAQAYTAPQEFTRPVLAVSGPAPLLMDVTPLSLGLETAGGYCQHLIRKNTPIPTEQTRIFSTAQDGQAEVLIRICQGDARAYAENQALGDVRMTGLRDAPRGGVRIEVTFILDASGTLDVRAVDVETGSRQATRINLLGGVSDEEIRAMQNRQSAALARGR